MQAATYNVASLLEMKLPECAPQLSQLSPNQLAYVIFTSGSTGRPKGVMVEHAQVMNLYYSLKAEVFQHYPQQSKVCLNSSLSFDASLQSLLSLLDGHQLHILPNDIRVDGERLVQFIQQNAIDVFDCTPTQLEMLLLCELPLRVEQLILLIGGEAVSTQTWLRLCAIKHFTAFNVYGPTECTVDATLAQISERHLQPIIGRPLANTVIYLLDDRLRPVPFGAVGHMYISGAGVARGYLDQPALTAERFSPDPFLSKRARMYRTGDLARYLDDGNLEYLGRDDQQVKIKGYRIEPGEIEEKLLSHPQINKAVVIAYQTPAGEKQLASYLVMAEGAEKEVLPRRLREYLGNLLPEFMLPTAYVSMTSLPVTPNGKIDHKRLPAPDVNAYVHELYQAPQGDTEQQLHDIWANLLCVEKIGRNDNFFAIGGDSLMAMKLLSAVQSRWNGKITLKEFFTDPTLTHLASLVLHSKQLATRQIVPVIPDSQHPLSFAQNRLWFIEQLSNHDENYQVPLLLKMHGSLNPDLLQRCLDHLIDRHASLRSVFTVEDGVGYSKLLPTSGWPPLKKYDFSAEEQPHTAVEKLYQHEIAHKFTISQGPLVRASLAKTGDDEHYFLLIIHHIVTDGWSMEILARELGALYSAWHQQQANPLPVLALQYPDYAHWQQQCLHGKEWDEHAQFWREQLQGAPERLTLPTDRERPALQSFLGAAVPIELDPQLCDKLRLLSQKHHTTLYMTLMSAWSIVLSRLAGQQDLVVGTPVANRQVPKCEALVGFFVNTLAIRIDLTDAPTVAELLAQVRELTLNAQEHQEWPFDHVVELLQPHRSMDKTPLFQVMFAWENFDAVAPAMVGLDVQVLDPQVTHVKFDLELNLGPRSNGIVGSLNYATALFDKETIERHKAYLIAVIEAMVNDETQPVSQIDLVGEAERHLLLQQWNQTAKPYPANCCIHQLFEQHAKQDPHAVALINNTCTLSYGELNQRANALAYQLIEQGVKAEEVVAICADRSPEMIVGILAILKAGGAYLSLPHDIAAERLKFMLDDAKPVVILAEQATLALFQGCGIPHHLLPQTDAVVSAWANPGPQLTRHNLAYVIYTSGSTGNPKGVLVEHGNLVQQMVTWCQQWSLGKQDKVLQFCNTTFDVSVSEIFSALTSGATLVLRDDQWLAGSTDFWQLCHQYGISYLDIPYQFWRKLCEESDGPLPPALRLVCISGEAAAPEMLERWLKRYPAKPELVNCYGPTETTITATIHSPKLGGDHIEAIGRPTANIRIYLLSPEGLVVPRGVIGEVYIGGPGVTRGYLNLPEMTSERFLPDPFNPVIGSRMYRTGDLASYLADGRLQFHGRNDHQVKIRGFRIELGEIETQLNGHLQVKEALVLALDHKGSKRLIAYMVAAPGAAPLEPMAVRQYLQNRLPDYMIPAAYVLLDKMPLTPNGKLDRKALPEPRESAFLLQPYEAPVSVLESLIADTWQTLLGVAQVGRYDHFFELGGHSLLAVSTVNLINQAIEDRIGVSDIFIAPTVKQLALRIKSQTRSSEVVNLHQYAQLPEDIQPLSGGHKQGSAILLTGATGFVGRFLLRELLDATPGKIYCLVRGQSRADSLQRLKSILDEWSLWQEGDEHRIIAIQGDIKQPQLGMDEQTYASVSKDVGVIFHSAVSMNHLESFEMAYQANIAGLIELLRLATQGTNKILNFASTLNVFSPMTQTGHRVVNETTSIQNERHITSQGYVASKWIGEAIVNLAVTRGIACNIFRLGLITADSELARYDELQGFYRLFKSSIQMGMAFDDVYGDIELTPVDFTAKALARLGGIFNPAENIFHLSNLRKIPRRDFIKQLNEHLPQPMAVVSYRQWLQEARRRYQKGEVLPITPLIQDMMMSSDQDLDNFYHSQQAITLSYDSINTMINLEKNEITLPMTNRRWYRLLVDSFKE